MKTISLQCAVKLAMLTCFFLFVFNDCGCVCRLLIMVSSEGVVIVLRVKHVLFGPRAGDFNRQQKHHQIPNSGVIVSKWQL